jgi:Txe/YoeB family toxin of Txe-Axe toxin-antitoxin module
MRREIRLLEAAVKDIERLAEDDPRLAIRARALLGLLEDGRATGAPLASLPSFGDLSDCRKIYFGRSDDITHRIVYRIIDDTEVARIEVLQVVAIEQRDEAYAYLLASRRLGGLPTESAPKLKRVHQIVIARRGAARAKRTGRTE